MNLYLDTSALLKRYKSEVGSNNIDAIFASNSQDFHLLTSDFTLVEATGVAARMHRAAVLSDKAYEAFLHDLYSDLLQRFVLLEPSVSVIAQAVSLAARHGLKGADAIHIGSAKHALSSSTGSLALVSADRGMLSAATLEGMVVVNPESSDALTVISNMLRP